MELHKIQLLQDTARREEESKNRIRDHEEERESRIAIGVSEKDRREAEKKRNGAFLKMMLLALIKGKSDQ